MHALTATYRLSENGRKASLLAGGDGHSLQHLSLQVPASRLHLVSVDREGVARLRLRPRFERGPDQRIVQLDAPPVFDAPPTIEELYRTAARNHELEQAFHAERLTAQARRHETDRELRDRVGRAFLADKAQRALTHPAPSAKRCHIWAEHRRLLFDIAQDEGVAREVPAEANRRFQADLRATQERRSQERAAQLALHDEKKRFIAAWIGEHGSDEQKARQMAGMLPMAEAIEALTDYVFAPLGDRPQYRHDGASRLTAHLAQFPAMDGVVVTQADVRVDSEHAQMATAEQWALLEECRSLLPTANVRLRRHRISFARDAAIPPILLFALLVTLAHGPFSLRREYLV